MREPSPEYPVSRAIAQLRTGSRCTAAIAVRTKRPSQKLKERNVGGSRSQKGCCVPLRSIDWRRIAMAVTLSRKKSWSTRAATPRAARLSSCRGRRVRCGTIRGTTQVNPTFRPMPNAEECYFSSGFVLNSRPVFAQSARLPKEAYMHLLWLGELTGLEAGSPPPPRPFQQ